MSLYDKYYSDINKSHIYNLLIKLINDDFHLNIENKKYYDLFNQFIDENFKENNFDELVDYNKKLIDKFYNHISLSNNNNNNKNNNNNNNRMYYIEPNEEIRLNCKYYIIGGIILYLPLIISNLVILNTMNNLDDLVDTQENMEYIDKIKYLINQACQMIDCTDNI